MATSIALGNASYGFREYGLAEVFAASREIGLTSVEIDCGWLEEESSNKIGVDASPRELDAVLRLAADAGVRRARLPAQRAFWFGWYAQFPATELIR